MIDGLVHIKTGCDVRWAFAGAVEEIRRSKLDEDFEPVECHRCGTWHIVRKPRRAAA